MADIKLTPTRLQGNFTAKLSTTAVQQVQIQKTPQALQNLDRAVTLRGEVQNTHADGSADIKTQRGTITVKADPPLQQGQKMDIQISTGNPPRDAIVQSQQNPKQTQPQTNTQTSTPPQQQAPSTGQTQTQAQPQAQAQTQAQPQSQSQAPTTPQNVTGSTQSQPSTNTPSADPNAVRNLQQTAQQANQTQLGKAQSQQADPSSPQSQPNAPALKTGQPIRLTPLPANMQNLANLPSLGSATLQTTPTQLNQVPKLGTSPFPLPQNATSSNLLQLTQSLTGSNNALLFNAPSPSLGTQQSLLNNFAPNTVLKNGITLTTGTTGTTSNITGNSVGPEPITQGILNSLPTSSLQSKPVLSTPNHLPDLRVMNVQNTTTLQPTMVGGTSLTQNTFTISSITQHTMTQAPQLQAGQILGIATGQTKANGNPIIAIQTNTSPTTGLSQPLNSITTPPNVMFFALNYPASNVAQGTQIVLQPSPPSPTMGQQTAPNLTPTNANALPMGQTGQPWPALQEAYDFLLNQLSASQGQALLNTLPRPASSGFQFTAAAMIFIAAVRGGDLAGWMGGRADNLLKNSSTISDKDNLANKLLRDIGTMSGRPSSSADAPQTIQNAADWRGYTLPMLFGMDITRLNLWVKPYEDPSEAPITNEKQKNLRFIFDVNLSRMGNIVLDGLIQPYAKRLDLSLKSEQQFTSSARQDLRSLWHNALIQIDMHGDLDFQTA